jgi:hypothetical protein
MANRNVETSNGEIYAPGAAPGSPTEGQVYYDSTEHLLKFRTNSGWVTAGGGSGGTTMGSFGSTPNANGGTITSGVLYLQPADGMYPGGVTATAQTFNGVKTFAAIISPVVYNTNGTGASDICVKSGSSVADASVNGTAELLRVCTGMGATEVPSIRVLKGGRILSEPWGVENSEVTVSPNSGASLSSWRPSSPPYSGDEISLISCTAAAGIEATSTHGTHPDAADTCIGVGTHIADASVGGSAKLLSVFTEGTAAVIPYFSVTKTACNVISSAWVAAADYVHNSTEIRTDGMIARYGRDRSSAAGGQTEYAPVGNNSIASGATSSTITTSFATTSSHILITWLGDHGAARSWVTRAAGSFTVNLSSAASGDTGFSWMVTSFLTPWMPS